LFTCFAVGYGQTTPIYGIDNVGGTGYASVTAALTAASSQPAVVFNGLGTFGGFTNANNIAVEFLDAQHAIGGLVFPEEWGAYGDGSHDDAAAVQACLNYSGSNQAKCEIIPQTSYLLDETVTIPTKSTMEGVGMNNVSEFKCEVNGDCFASPGTILQSVTIQNIDIICDATLANSVGIDFTSSNSPTATAPIEDSHISFVGINNCAAQGLKLYGGSNGLGNVSAVTAISGSFSGTGTIFLTGFNNCSTATAATVTLASGSYSSAAVTTPGTCTAAPTTAICTSGTASCPPTSPVTIDVTAALGSSYANTAPVQFLTITHLEINGPHQSHPLPDLDIQGQNGQLIFIDLNLEGDSSTHSNFPNALLNIAYASPSHAYTIKFLNSTIQSGDAGVYAKECVSCQWDGAEIEGVSLPFEFNDVSTGTLENIHVSDTTGTIIQDDGNNDVIVSNVRFGGNETTLANCSSAAASSHFEFFGTAEPTGRGISPITTNACSTSNVAVSGTTLTTNFDIVNVNAASSIQTIVASTPAGHILTLHAPSTGAITLESGVNIDFGSVASPYVVPPSGIVQLLHEDLPSDEFLLLVPTSATGTTTYSSSQTASAADNGKYVIMSCSSTCAYTLPTTQPSPSWHATLVSIGSTVATVGLSGGDTFNGGPSAPVLNSYRIVPIWANTATSTDYEGDAPLVAGTGIALTPGANGMTIAATGPMITVGKILSPVYNTGSTSSTQIASVTIPANTVTGTGTLRITLSFGACTGNATPYASCTSANTGTCTPNIYLGSTSTGQNFAIRNTPAIPATKFDVTNFLVQQQNSLSSEISTYSAVYSAASDAPAPAFGSLNMGNAAYLNVYMTNSVATDQCYVGPGDVQAQP
jgi:hypothetical protein